MSSALATRYAPTGMVCSVDHLASAAGVAMLRAGGSAADAAVAASAVLAVTAPGLGDMGGDLFAIVHDTRGPPKVLNSSGRAGSGADPVRLRAEGRTEMPFLGDVRSVPVPGCVDGWLALHGRFGRLTLEAVLEPAAVYAATGFPASPLLAEFVPLLDGVVGADDFFVTRPLRSGDVLRRPGVAMCLQAIASDGRTGFYQGVFGEGLLELGRGEYMPEDLTRIQAEWVDPLGIRAWGHDVWTAPPNSQGYLTLLSVAIAEGLKLPEDPADPAWPHLLVEAARVAGHDRPDVLHEAADVRPLLTPEEVARRRAAIHPDRRAALRSLTAGGGTTYVCAVDRDRMGISLIQSNASGFGSQLFVAGVGIGLHNRGIGFSLHCGHPAELAPRRRPPHTLSPALVTRPDGSLRAVLGTMGGDSQPQILLQLLARLLHHSQSPGTAIGAPRWVLTRPNATGFDTWVDPDAAVVAVEESAPPGWADGLRARGHRVEEAGPAYSFGHAHLIEVGSRRLAGAADPRALIGDAAGY